MNKAALAQAVADRLNLSRKDAETMIEATVDIITETLVKGGEVTIAGFGAFSAKARKGRLGVNPQNPDQKMQIPSVVDPKFKAGLRL